MCRSFNGPGWMVENASRRHEGTYTYIYIYNIYIYIIYIYVYVYIHICVCIYTYTLHYIFTFAFTFTFTYMSICIDQSKWEKKKRSSHNSHQLQGFEASAPKRSPPWPMRIWSSRCEDDKRSDLISGSWDLPIPAPLLGQNR